MTRWFPAAILIVVSLAACSNAPALRCDPGGSFVSLCSPDDTLGPVWTDEAGLMWAGGCDGTAVACDADGNVTRVDNPAVCATDGSVSCANGSAPRCVVVTCPAP